MEERDWFVDWMVGCLVEIVTAVVVSFILKQIVKNKQTNKPLAVASNCSAGQRLSGLSVGCLVACLILL